jgi:hypothetical protein
MRNGFENVPGHADVARQSVRKFSKQLRKKNCETLQLQQEVASLNQTGSWWTVDPEPSRIFLNNCSISRFELARRSTSFRRCADSLSAEIVASRRTQLDAERSSFVIATSLGLLCGTANPTKMQEHLGGHRTPQKSATPSAGEEYASAAIAATHTAEGALLNRRPGRCRASRRVPHAARSRAASGSASA